jgi:hypothetical protein
VRGALSIFLSYVPRDSLTVADDDPEEKGWVWLGCADVKARIHDVGRTGDDLGAMTCTRMPNPGIRSSTWRRRGGERGLGSSKGWCRHAFARELHVMSSDDLRA